MPRKGLSVLLALGPFMKIASELCQLALWLNGHEIFGNVSLQQLDYIGLLLIRVNLIVIRPEIVAETSYLGNAAFFDRLFLLLIF